MWEKRQLVQISLPSASTVQLGDWLFAGGLGIRFSLALAVPARLFGRASLPLNRSRVHDTRSGMTRVGWNAKSSAQRKVRGNK